LVPVAKLNLLPLARKPLILARSEDWGQKPHNERCIQTLNLSILLQGLKTEAKSPIMRDAYRPSTCRYYCKVWRLRPKAPWWEMHTDPQPVDTIVLLFQPFQTEIETDPNIQTQEVEHIWHWIFNYVWNLGRIIRVAWTTVRSQQARPFVEYWKDIFPLGCSANRLCYHRTFLYVFLDSSAPSHFSALQVKGKTWPIARTVRAVRHK
jgi:hypothetical protein